MFDIAPTELLLCAVVALVVIGPKDLPKAMRTVGQFVAKVRGIGRHFRSGFDEMVREAELKEMEETWAKENARIMREHPPEEIHDAEYAHGTDVALPPPVPPALIDVPPAATPVHGAQYEHEAPSAHDTQSVPEASTVPETSASTQAPRHDAPAAHDASTVGEGRSSDGSLHHQPPVATHEAGRDGDHKRMDQQ